MAKRQLNTQGNPFALLLMFRLGKIPVSKWLHAFRYLFRSFVLLPFYLSELIFRKKRIERTIISSSPIFIIGHYRSGTTYLHKLLSCDPRWGKIKTIDFIFPYFPDWLYKFVKPIFQSLIDKLKLKNPHFNNYILDLDDPMEEDMITVGSFSPYSAFWGEIFPKNFKKIIDRQLVLNNNSDKENWKQTYIYLLKKITLKSKGDRLLLKNPPNTARVRHILELFPDAKFVFIYRNPYEVYYSTWRLWKNLLEKKYALQTITDQEREENIFYNYKLLMERYLEDKNIIPANNLIEVSFDELKNNPLKQIKSVYEKLNLDGFENVESLINELLLKEKNYSTYNYTYDTEALKKINEEWGPFIDYWKHEKITEN